MPMYSIAGLHVAMEPRHSLTAVRAKEYLCDADNADIVLPPMDGDAGEEYAALALSLYSQLLPFDGFLLHASAVELDGKAYLFSASSGTGKSTHTSFWQQELGAQMINDDKPALRRIDGVFHACGTPFCGKENKSRNVCVPLGAVAVLRRGDETRVEPLSKRDALFCLLNQTVRPNESASLERMLTLAERLIEDVPFYAVYVTKDPTSAHVVSKEICK